MFAIVLQLRCIVWTSGSVGSLEMVGLHGFLELISRWICAPGSVERVSERYALPVTVIEHVAKRSGNAYDGKQGEGYVCDVCSGNHPKTASAYV